MERVIIKSGKTLKQKINVLNLKIEFNHLIFRRWILNKYVFSKIFTFIKRNPFLKNNKLKLKLRKK